MAHLHNLGAAPSAPRSPARRSRRRRRLLALSGAALAALLLPALHAPAIRIVWNASASVPLGLYRIEPHARLRVGDLGLLRPSPALARLLAERRYVGPGVPLLKPVAAAKGATVCRTDTRVTINGRRVATALPRDRFGRPLPRWSGCRRLAADEVFLIASASAGSFDSRYFGPITHGQVIGRAVPVWTWR